jgi:hypothetical protein
MSFDIKQARKLCDGFNGRFVFDPAHTEDRGVGNVADFVDIEDRLVYIPSGSELHDDECVTISSDIDQPVAEAIAELLNSAPGMLTEVVKLRAALRDAGEAIDEVCAFLGSPIQDGSTLHKRWLEWRRLSQG